MDFLELFKNNTPDILASEIVKSDGFLLADTAKKGVDVKRYAAMTAGLFGLSERVLTAIKSGILKQTYVKGEKAEIILMAIPGKKLFVDVMARKDPNIGLSGRIKIAGQNIKKLGFSKSEVEDQLKSKACCYAIKLNT